MQPLGADARAVRPYMPLISNSSYHFANHKVQSPKFKLQSQQIIKVKVQCSKPKSLHACNPFVIRSYYVAKWLKRISIQGVPLSVNTWFITLAGERWLSSSFFIKSI